MRLMHKVYPILLFIALATAAQSAQQRAAKVDQSLRWAERTLQIALALPTRKTTDSVSRGNIEELSDAFRRLVQMTGGAAEAYLGLGKCQVCLGDYEAALDSFAQALKAMPESVEAKTELEKVQALLEAARAIRPLFPAESNILEMRGIAPAEAGKIWLVLAAKKEQRGEFPEFSEAYLYAFKPGAQGMSKIWQSGQLLDARFGDNFNDLRLFLLPTKGGEAPQVAVWEVTYGASWTPSHLELFAWRKSGMKKTFGLSSDDPIALEDLNHDGQVEIINDYAIGESLAHYEQPRWTDIYAQKHGVYVLANQDFPREFHGLAKEIRCALRTHPKDAQLRKYLGKVKEIERHPAAR